MISYKDEYEEYISEVKDDIEAIAGERCEIRFADVQKEAADKIAEARQEIADGEKELEDARTELADAQLKLDDAAKEIADAEKEIADAEKEIQDAKDELHYQRHLLEDGWEELNKGKQDLADAEEQISDARQQLSSGSSQLAQGRKELDAQNAQFEAYASQVEPLKDEAAYAQAQQNYQGLQYLQSTGAQLTAEQQTALGFYGSILPSLSDDSASRAQTIDGMLSPTRQQIADGYAQLDAAGKELSDGYDELDDAQAEYDDAVKLIEENEQTLLDAEQKIKDAWADIRQAEKELEEGRQELMDGKKEYEDALTEFTDAKAEFDEKSADAEKDIADGKQKIADAEEELAKLEVPEWYVLDRGSIQHYVEYGLDAERIGALGKVFPVIFFMVAALVALTTMTRMVEEGRLQIGTMKALGYSKFAIAGKYIGYALSATLLGGALGIPVGTVVFPWVIMAAYGILYVYVPTDLMPVQWIHALSAIGFALLSTVGATVAACYKELAAVPAQLMRPVAPPEGKRVLLERIPALWKRMNFTQKSTFRNLFRYKKRLLMTVFGIGACMGLLLVGFGLRDSIADIVNKQYRDVWTYDVSVTLDADKPEALPAVEDALTDIEEIRAQLTVKVTALDARAHGIIKPANIFVPKNPGDLGQVVRMQTRKGKLPVELTGEGVVITEKLANMLELEIGESIDLMIDETDFVTATVTGIAENYLHHYIYMTPALYRQLYGEEPDYGAIYLNTGLDKEAESALAEKLLATDDIIGVSFVSDLQAQVSDMMKSLDYVVWVLVLAAGLLAFIVLYNLNNISVIERRRELATLKVLGFHDMEVAAYVYRENVWLTFFGILLGLAMGLVLHKFVIRTVEVDMIMFGQDIKPLSYVLAAVTTGVFAVIVNFFMYFSLKKINMVESLKSVE